MVISTQLKISNPDRLGALKFSVFYYKVFNDQDISCKIAKETLELARKELADYEEDDEHKDAFSIMALLQDNLNIRTIDNES